MSEAERRKRLNYKKNRKKLIFIQAIAIAAIAVLIAASALTYFALDKTYYIDYVEEGRVDYKVQYKPNSYYEDEWQTSGQQYVTELVNAISANFQYGIVMGAKNVNYKYSYKIDAAVEVVDDRTDNVIFRPTYELKGETTKEQSSNSQLIIDEDIMIDFPTYNTKAEEFVKEYGLSSVTSTLVVTMTVNVKGTSDEFAVDSQNSYFTTLHIPLTERTMNIESTESIPTESKVLAYKDAVNQNAFKTVSVVLGLVELFAVLIFVTFVYVTRNHDVNYSIKVQKLLSSYRSFIQKITNGFDIRGYQILTVDTFTDMLAIRDTIQSPVLMSENTDQTRTQFFIPTNTKILYLYEIKVDNYDDIYGNHPEYVDDSVVPTDSIIPKLVADVTPKVISEAADKVVGVVTERLDTAINAATPGMVETAVSEARAAVDKRIAEMPAPATVSVPVQTAEPNVDRTAEALAEKLLKRLAEAELKEKSDPVINLSFNPVIDTPEPVVNVNVTPVEPVVNVNVAPTDPVINLSVNPVVEREVIREVIATAEVAPTESEPEVKVEVEAEPEREPVVYEQIEIASGIPMGEREIITVTATTETPEAVETPVEETPAVVEEAPATETSDEENDDEDGEIFILDENGNKVGVRVSRSFTANIIQSDPETVKAYYGELKNHILSYKNVKSRMAWRYETFKKGRYQLFRMKIRGKTVCLYCALDPNEFDPNKYFHEASDAKMFENVPMLVKIRSDRGLKKAKELIDITMDKFEMKPDPKAETVDYNAAHPYETTEALIEQGLIKILTADFSASEKSTETDEERLTLAINEAMATPDVVLDEIDYVKEEIVEYVETDDKPGVEVVGVVWNERDHGNKIYRYDPNGETLHDGDVVLVPTKSSSKETVRKAAVAEGNHKVDPDTVHHPLKKIISVVKRKMEDILSGD